MFTGIVEELGELVRRVETGADSTRIAVRGPLVTSDARHGESISVNGVCLTVVEVDGDVFTTAGSVATWCRDTSTGSPRSCAGNRPSGGSW